MAISRHIEDVFTVLRRGNIKAYKGTTGLVIARLDTYPEDGDNDIIFLSNGKRITVSDLEFAEILLDDDDCPYIILGDYSFFTN